MELVGRIFAGIGAAGVLTALTFVSLLIGVLVHGMFILIAGKPIISARRAMRSSSLGSFDSRKP